MKTGEMSIFDHLEELRWRIFKSLGSIFLFAILTFNFADTLVELLIAPTKNISQQLALQVLTIQGMFVLKWNLAFIGGIIFQFPSLQFNCGNLFLQDYTRKSKRFFCPLFYRLLPALSLEVCLPIKLFYHSRWIFFHR